MTVQRMDHVGESTTSPPPSRDVRGPEGIIVELAERIG